MERLPDIQFIPPDRSFVPAKPRRELADREAHAPATRSDPLSECPGSRRGIIPQELDDARVRLLEGSLLVGLPADVGVLAGADAGRLASQRYCSTPTPTTAHTPPRTIAYVPVARSSTCRRGVGGCPAPPTSVGPAPRQVQRSRSAAPHILPTFRPIRVTVELGSIASCQKEAQGAQSEGLVIQGRIADRFATDPKRSYRNFHSAGWCPISTAFCSRAISPNDA